MTWIPPSTLTLTLFLYSVQVVPWNWKWWCRRTQLLLVLLLQRSRARNPRTSGALWRMCSKQISSLIFCYSAPVGERSIAISLSVCVCLSASISLELLDRSSRNCLCGAQVAVSRSSSGDVAIRYVLPVLCMTSRLAVRGRTRCVEGWTFNLYH